MMSKKKQKGLFPEGTTLRQVDEAFRTLEASSNRAIAEEAAAHRLTVEEILTPETLDVPMHLEELWPFRDAYAQLLARKEHEGGA